MTSMTAATVVQSHLMDSVVVDDYEVVTGGRHGNRASAIWPLPVSELDAQPELLEGPALEIQSCPILGTRISIVILL
jgi:hypothetical protein